MLKRMTLLAKREDLDRAAFRLHWAGNHAQLALSLPGVCKYVQNRVNEELLTIPEARAFSVDGIVELYFTDAETMKVAQASETGAVSIPDDELLFLKGWSLNIVETVGPHDHGGTKVMIPIKVRGGLDADEVTEKLSSASKALSSLETSVNEVTSSHSRPRLWSEPVAPDAIFVCWFKSPAAAKEAFYPGTDLHNALIETAEVASAYLCDPLVIK